MRRRVHPWLAVLVALAAGCKRSPPPPAAPPEPPAPALGTISVQDLTADESRPKGAHIDTGALERRARELMTASRLFAAGGGDGGAQVAARLRVEVALEEVAAGDKAAARAALRLRIDTRPGGVAAPRWTEDVQAGAEAPFKAADAPDRSVLFQKLVTRTLEDLLGGYLARQRLWSGDHAALGAALRADGGELRLEAIHAIGGRKLAAEAPTLLALLEDQDEAVRDAALGALVELRDRRAVPVLARQRSMRDRREMRKILDAIALLGGDEAADYLAFVADGHDDQEIREMAAEARRRLLRRAGVDAL
jgi:HEAT repeat protein